ncbi:hypothetical protein FRC14_004084 [Serendipita sp. 396]|nr:hypothetical protein FRC14_004084 [Serendipita sp. 396]KAG8874228.1 hypothetical protein FRC20_006434 [Serendipita sp. 405]
MLLCCITKHRIKTLFPASSSRIAHRSKSNVRPTTNEERVARKADTNTEKHKNKKQEKEYQRFSNRNDASQNVWTLEAALDASEVNEFTNIPDIENNKKTEDKGKAVDRGPKDGLQMYRNPTYSERLFTWTYHPLSSPIPPTPTTKDELRANIVAMRNSVPVIPLVKIMQYHDMFPWLQSSASFDILLELAVRISSIAGARKLIRGMLSQSISFTETTLALVTRMKLRVIHRLFAQLRTKRPPPEILELWKDISLATEPAMFLSHAQAALDDTGLRRMPQSMSANSLLEFLTVPHRKYANMHKEKYLSAIGKNFRRIYAPGAFYLQQQPGPATELPYRLSLKSLLPSQLALNSSDTQDSRSLAKMLRRRYKHITQLPPRQFDPQVLPLSPLFLQRLFDSLKHDPTLINNPRLHLLLVRRLLLQNRREIAIRHAQTYIRSVCAEQTKLPPSIVRRIRGLIHLLIHRKYGCPSLRVGEETLSSILDIHPDITPDSFTLCILLNHLVNTTNRGPKAIQLLKRFRGRWEGIENEAVRRTIAVWALKDKNKVGSKIARDMAQREADLGTRWRVPTGCAQDLTRARLRPFREIFDKWHADKEKWIRMGLVKRAPGFVLERDDLARLPKRGVLSGSGEGGRSLKSDLQKGKSL